MKIFIGIFALMSLFACNKIGLKEETPKRKFHDETFYLTERTRETVKLNAPYVFLSMGNLYGPSPSEYEVFLCIPHAAGQKVSFNESSGGILYSNGFTQLAFSITEDATIGEGKFFKRVSLNPKETSQANGYSFNPNTFFIKVNVNYQALINGQTSTVTKSSKIYYNSVDLNPPSEDQVAFDCPYLYLWNPDEGANNQIDDYQPYCIIPLKYYQFDPNNPVSQTYNEAVDAIEGQCEQQIFLTPGGVTPSNATNTSGVEQSQIINYREIDPASIWSNNEVYHDPNVSAGWYQLSTNLGELNPNYPTGPMFKRKGKIKNASSDPN